MSSFTVCLNAVLPIFIIMALGYLARRCGAIKRSDVPKLNKLAFYYFLPVMLFYNIRLHPHAPEELYVNRKAAQAAEETEETAETEENA